MSIVGKLWHFTKVIVGGIIVIVFFRIGWGPEAHNVSVNSESAANFVNRYNIKYVDKRFSLFRADIFRWGGTYAVDVKEVDNTFGPSKLKYKPLTDSITKKYETQPKLGLFDLYGRYILLGIIILWFVISTVKNKLENSKSTNSSGESEKEVVELQPKSAKVLEQPPDEQISHAVLHVVYLGEGFLPASIVLSVRSESGYFLDEDENIDIDASHALIDGKRHKFAINDVVEREITETGVLERMVFYLASQADERVEGFVELTDIDGAESFRVQLGEARIDFGPAVEDIECLLSEHIPSE